MDVNQELKFLENSKTKIGGRGGWVHGVGSRLGGQDGCEHRIEVFCENIKKKLAGGRGGRGGRVWGSGWM